MKRSAVLIGLVSPAVLTVTLTVPFPCGLTAAQLLDVQVKLRAARVPKWTRVGCW